MTNYVPSGSTIKLVVAAPTVEVTNSNGTTTALTPVSAATTTVNGTVKQATVQANSTATDVAGLVADFNALLAKLKTAGIMASS